MRFVIIFGTTFLICIYLIFFDPFAKYLAIYKNDMIIEYDIVEEGYHWECENNNILDYTKISDNKWKFETKKNGDASVIFNFVNDEVPSDIKYSIKYEFDVFFNQIFWSVGEAFGLSNFPNPY